MRRILATLLLLAAAVTVPVGMLVGRALESAAIEEENRHRSIAERAFDEMETSLSAFLAAEESRPFGAYRFYEEFSPTAPTARRRSPLSLAPQQPFVIGYFQIEPDGELRTPRRPRDLALAQELGDYQPSGEIDQLESTLRAAWTEGLRRPPRIAPQNRRLVEALHPGTFGAGIVGAMTAPEAPAQAMASADGLAEGKVRPSAKKAAAPQAALPPFAAAEPNVLATGREPARKDEQKREQTAAREDERSEDYSSYEVLRSLNLAGERRAQRKQKVQLERAPALDLDALSQRVAPESAALDDAAGAPALRSAAASPEEERPARRARQPGPATVRVALDPMVGRPTGEGTLLLYRTVVAGEQGYRQGLLVDWRALGDWLDAEVIAPSALEQASSVAFFDATGTEARDDTTEDGTGGAERAARDATGREAAAVHGDARRADAAYVYRHRFAEPFDGFGVELAMAPLPGGSGTGTIHALAILLVVVGAGGLYAVYRMVAVVVEFAERRNQFVAAVSHELKTPLTSIRLYAEMLRDGIVLREEKRDEYYRTITDESERLSRLIDNVLDFSRLEKGEREVRARSGPVDSTIAAAVEKLRPHAESQGFDLLLRPLEGLPPAHFDPDIVTQVIFNLVDNALKYAANAERKEIEIGASVLPSGRVALAVRDHGPGVPKAELGRIFEAFYRREDELTRSTKGTGIGLALVKELVEAMGGRIDASNAPGGGLCVTVEFAKG